MSGPVRAARWLLLPTHVAAAHRACVTGARAAVRGVPADVVHAHDFSALGLGAELARERGVPLVYDSHEYWPGRAFSGRPTPLRRGRERAAERRLGGAAAAVITVGDGLAEALRSDYGWDVTVVRNTFPRGGSPGPGTGRQVRPESPSGSQRSPVSHGRRSGSQAAPAGSGGVQRPSWQKRPARHCLLGRSETTHVQRSPTPPGPLQRPSSQTRPQSQSSPQASPSWPCRTQTLGHVYQRSQYPSAHHSPAEQASPGGTVPRKAARQSRSISRNAFG
jgi:hypothetical protein